MELNRKMKALISSFYGAIKEYRELAQQKKLHRCKLVNIQQNASTDKMEVFVRIEGIRSHLPIKFSPEELVVNDILLQEFSQEDVRMITYYALQNIELVKPKVISKPSYCIVSQEAVENKTLFVIRKMNDDKGEFRITAADLFASDILKQFLLPVLSHFLVCCPLARSFT